jgi:hypothetical protein
MNNSFPSFRYHQTEEPIIVNSAEEAEALGAEWADTPAAFGTITAPSVEQIREARMGAAKKAKSAK